MASSARKDFHDGAVMPFECDAMRDIMILMCSGAFALILPFWSVKGKKSHETLENHTTSQLNTTSATDKQELYDADDTIQQPA
jgi:hypothetical protein